MRIFVTGATGHVGTELVRGLLNAGHDVRALVRRAASAPDGAQPVVGDLNAPDSFAGGLDGIDGIFLLSGYDNLPVLLERARAAGAAHAVLLSSGAVGASTVHNAVVDYHERSEADVRDSGLPWTFLRPHSFMSNTRQWEPQLRASDTVVVPFADAASAVVDPGDIAAVAAAALTSEGHAGAIYRLTGPAALLPTQRLAILGAALGRDLHLEAQSNEDARTEMTAQMPLAYVESFFDFFVRGAYDEAEVHPGVADALGRAPRRFADWVDAHAAEFR